jgi:type IV secretory pathway component VirB8
MSDIPADVLVSRPGETDTLQAALADVRRDEQTRRWMRRLAFGVPWFLVVLLAAHDAVNTLERYNRPLPRDRFLIAMVHDDHTYDPPVDRENLTSDRRAILVHYTVDHFVRAWEGYQWRGNNNNYLFISAVTAGEDLRDVYQARFAENNPYALDKVYGPNVSRDVAAMQLIPVPGSHDLAEDVLMLIRLHKDGKATCQRWRARLTFHPDTRHVIPLDIQTLYNPADLIFASYDSSPDPTAPEIQPCAA